MGLFNKLDQAIFLKEDSDASDYIAKLTDLLPKATGDIKEKIEKEIKLTSIGEFGEKNIVFELKNSHLPMYVLRDIHLQHDDLSAQIDFIVITRFLTFMIECKNLIGNIEIDSNGNFVRSYEYNGKRIKEGIYSPITQNQRHLDVLKKINRDSRGNFFTKMLSDKVFDNFYQSIVVLANPKTILNAKFAKKEIKSKVIRADQLIQHIKTLNNQTERMASSDKEMKELAEILLSRHSPKQADYAMKYEEILAGLVLTEPEQLIASDTSSAPESTTSTTDPKDSFSQEELISALKSYRLKQSRKENIKPYYIFNDAQMMDLIAKMPNNKTQLLNVAGFGEVKAEKYGSELLDILSKYMPVKTKIS